MTNSSSTTELNTALQNKSIVLLFKKQNQRAAEWKGVISFFWQSHLRISFKLDEAKSGCATNRWRKSVFRVCRGHKVGPA